MGGKFHFLAPIALLVRLKRRATFTSSTPETHLYDINDVVIVLICVLLHTYATAALPFPFVNILISVKHMQKLNWKDLDFCSKGGVRQLYEVRLSVPSLSKNVVRLFDIYIKFDRIFF